MSAKNVQNTSNTTNLDIGTDMSTISSTKETQKSTHSDFGPKLALVGIVLMVMYLVFIAP